MVNKVETYSGASKGNAKKGRNMKPTPTSPHSDGEQLPPAALDNVWYYAGRHDDIAHGPVSGACVLQWIAQGKMTEEVRLKRACDASFTSLLSLIVLNGNKSPFYDTSELDAKRLGDEHETPLVGGGRTVVDAPLVNGSSVVYANRTTAIVNGSGKSSKAHTKLSAKAILTNGNAQSSSSPFMMELDDPAVLSTSISIMPNGVTRETTVASPRRPTAHANDIMEQVHYKTPPVMRDGATQTYELHIDSSFEFLSRALSADVGVGTDHITTQETAMQCVDKDVVHANAQTEPCVTHLSLGVLLGALQPVLEASGIVLTQ